MKSMKGVIVYPDGQTTIQVTKRRILSAHHMSMMAYDGCDDDMSFILMEIKLYDGKIIYIRMFENDGKYINQTWFDRMREMKANDKIKIIIKPKKGKNGLFQTLDGPHHKLYDGAFMSASVKK